MTTSKTLYKQIGELMKTPQASNKLASWLKQAKKTQSFIDAHRNTFNEWKPLKFYVTLGSTNTFSIRFKGQEVATLACSPGSKPMVKLSTEHMERNKRYFQLSCECHEFEWRSPSGQSFRKHFRNNNFKIRSPEHHIESELISGLIAKKPPTSTLRKRTAVTFSKFPLQFPVPYSACEGTIGTETGHIDILGRGKPGVLSVWELKSPNVWRGAARQAYIYALQIHSIINDKKIGKEWLCLFDISRESKAIKIEILVGVSKNYAKQVKKEISTLKEEMKEDGIEGLFSWNIAFYNTDLDAHKISIQPIQ